MVLLANMKSLTVVCLLTREKEYLGTKNMFSLLLL